MEEEEKKKMDVSSDLKFECSICNREIKDVTSRNRVKVTAGKHTFTPKTWGICDSCLSLKEKK